MYSKSFNHQQILNHSYILTVVEIKSTKAIILIRRENPPALHGSRVSTAKWELQNKRIGIKG